ncbi:hypothetical protein L6Q96_02490 [Candidatus Binatia bacterium]|nr:hypothetical protein [Candidatus Binatia bacterium]
MPAISEIPLLTPAEIDRLRREVRSRAAHLRRSLTWLDAVDVQQPAADERPARIRVAAFNIERGSRFDGIVALLSAHPALQDVDVFLISEADWGMARSGNRHVARDLAQTWALGYAYGIEFLELTKGEAAELDAPGDNTWSLHGNAILSRWPLVAPRVVRLPVHCTWAEGTQARVGGRMALLAEIETAAGDVTLASVHLENRTTPAGRREQMEAVLASIPAGAPAIVGGDLNTATVDGGRDEEIFSIPDLLKRDPARLRHPEPYEPLFASVREAGFLVDEVNAPDIPTCVPFGIRDPAYWLKLDWLFTRGVVPRTDRMAPSVVVAAVGDLRVSDHDCIVADLELTAIGK